MARKATGEVRQAAGLKDLVFIEVTLDKHDDKVLARFGDALARIPEVIEAQSRHRRLRLSGQGGGR